MSAALCARKCPMPQITAAEETSYQRVIRQLEAMNLDQMRLIFELRSQLAKAESDKRALIEKLRKESE